MNRLEERKSTAANQTSAAAPHRGRGGWRPNSGRKSRGLATRARLVAKLNTIDRSEQHTLGPLLKAEQTAVAEAMTALETWDRARVCAELTTELRTSATAKYLEARSEVLAAIAALGPLASQRPLVADESPAAEPAGRNSEGL